MRALVRPVSDSFDRALTRVPGPPPDVARARAEHAAYVAALSAHVDRVIEVPAAPHLPDACFVEDTVVVAGGRALLTRPGAPSRRAELPGVRQALPEHLEVLSMPEGAVLDGGDVLRVGRTLFVGRSARTDAAGVAALREAFAPLDFRVVPVAVRDALHLKCHCSTPGRDVVLLAEGFADPALFTGCRVVPVPAAEAYAANVVGLGQHVLIAQGYPRTAGALNALGFDPIALPVTEIARADGSLTCLSVLVAGPEDC